MIPFRRRFRHRRGSTLGELAVLLSLVIHSLLLLPGGAQILGRAVASDFDRLNVAMATGNVGQTRGAVLAIEGTLLSLSRRPDVPPGTRDFILLLIADLDQFLVTH